MNQTTELTDPARFDVREIPCRVKHARIFQRWAELPVQAHFVLVNDHDPVPLYYQFAAQFPGAFSWEYLVAGPDEFQVKITKLQTVTAPAADLPAPLAPAGSPCGAAGDIEEIDARGLEPPEPLIRILDALESLPAGRRLRAITDRKPCHLFGEAGQRGFRHETTEQPDGSWITLLSRN
ncbi:MAG TPA: DUF2249 domain-containing protein [Opitutus sp.]|nr:DUF2249 domain-containing protein [Opitutus sp.]